MSNYLKRLHLDEIIEECENLAKYIRGHLPSVLQGKPFETMRDFSWDNVLTEAKERCLSNSSGCSNSNLLQEGRAKCPEERSYADCVNWNNLSLAAASVQ